MYTRKLHLKTDPKVGSYIEDFKSTDVVLSNYFFATEQNFFLSNDLYTDREVGIILHLTDKEYADLIHSFFSDNSLEESNKLAEDTRQKIQQLEDKLAKSKAYEDARQRLVELEEQKDSLTKKIASVSDIQQKYDETLNEYNKFAHLKKYDLQRIHNDLLSIVNEIKDLEQKVFDTKIEKIQSSKSIEYDTGKIVFSLSLGLGFFLAGVVLNLIRSPFGIVLGVWSLGLVVCFFLLYKARTEVEAEYYEGENQDSSNIAANAKRRLEELKNDKARILSLIKVKSAEDFFNIKAQFGAYSKSLSYFNEQRNNSLQGENYNTIKDDLNNTTSEINSINQILQDESVLLQPEEYLSIRREIDFLKLSQNSASANSGLSKDEVVQKLQDIKKELKDKLPDFCGVLKDSFKASFNEIKESIDTLCEKLGVESINVDDTGNGFENLSILQKYILQYSLFKKIYMNDFVFAVGAHSSDTAFVSDIEGLSNLIPESECKFYLLEE